MWLHPGQWGGFLLERMEEYLDVCWTTNSILCSDNYFAVCILVHMGLLRTLLKRLLASEVLFDHEVSYIKTDTHSHLTEINTLPILSSALPSSLTLY